MERRKFLNLSAVFTAGLALNAPAQLLNTPRHKVKVILFDAFAVFDPAHVSDVAKEMYPEKSAALMKEWRTKQFEYTWLRTVMNNYKDFFSVTEDALMFAADAVQLTLSDTNRAQLLNAFYQLKVWPEATQALAGLTTAGYRLGFLSNFTPEMLERNVRNTGIVNLFEHLISTDKTKNYKPAPVTYQMGPDIFGVNKSEIIFVPSAGWDAAGAKGFGFNTFWINRISSPMEQLGAQPDGTGKNLNDLLDYLK